MTQDKMRKVIAACVSASTVLLVILVAFLCYQWITMAVLDKREKKIDAEIAHWEEQNQEALEYLEYAESDMYKEYAYWKLIAMGK